MFERWCRMQPQLNADLAIRPRANIKSAINRDGAVLLDIDRGQMLSCNPMGAHIWQLIEIGTPQAEIVAAIVKECGVATEIAARDVDEFLTVLRNHELIK
jgi:hypothetical protein